MEILAGVAGSGKTTRLIGEYREALRAAQAGGLLAVPLWLAPGGPARGAVLERLCDGSLPVLFSPNVLTFAGFAKQVLRAASQAVTPLTPAMQRLLLRRIVGCLAATDRLPCFGGIAHTAGFLDVVEAFIAELKRNETWPERLTGACAERGERPADRDLALIYDEYQRTLLHNHVYDAEGEFWSARQALQAGDWGPFDRLSLVVVDGFTDFTPTQYEILSLLARKADRTVISLTLERQAGRNDLFAKPLAVLQRLLRSESATLVWVGEEGTPRPEIPAAIAQVAMRLFSNPRTVTRVANASEIELVAAAGQQGEVNWLAARIKRLLLDGTPPEAIVVALRGLAQ